MSRIQEIGRFNAVSDTGKTYTIVTYQEFTPGWNRYNNPFDLIPGSKIMETTNSQKVDSIDSDTFQITATGEILHKTGGQPAKKTRPLVVRIVLLFSIIGTALIIAYIIVLLLSK